MNTKRVCLLGGTGFVGRHLTYELANRGIECRIVTRRPQRHKELKATLGTQLVQANPFDAKQLSSQLKGCDAVVNLVGILNQNKRASFRRLHVELADSIVEASHLAEVPQLLHMSALNADECSGTSQYLRTKGEAENRVHTKGHPGIAVTSFRPSVIFGPDDSFINRFATLLKLPGPFPLACPDARFAPVYVGDVAKAMANTLFDPSSIDQHFDLCGPQVYTLEGIVRYIAKQLRLNKSIIPLSDTLSAFQAKLLQLAPGKPFSMDNYLSMKQPSVCAESHLELLGVTPTHMDQVVPQFLQQQDVRGEFNKLRRLC